MPSCKPFTGPWSDDDHYSYRRRAPSHRFRRPALHPGSEASLAVECVRIATFYGLKDPLFFTGRAIIEDGAGARDQLMVKPVEISGHGWDALRSRWWHRMLSWLTSSPHVPSWLQRRMIQRTCITTELYTGRSVRSWRSHAYRYDEHTPRLLAEAGITVWSDEVQLEHYGPRCHPDGVLILPINTLPDHEHLYHGARTPESVAAEGRGPSYPPNLWYDQICAQVEAIVSSRGIATVLAHPICVKVVDDFATFERLCAFLSNYPSLFASEAAERLCDQ